MIKTINRKIKIGTVVSNKMDKTIVVNVENLKKHKLYKKRYKVSKKFKAHDKNNNCFIGDTVKIIETRPLSKTKNFRVLEILKTVKKK